MFKVLTKGCEPKRGSKYSACVDLFASEDVVIGAGETKLVGLGVCIDIEKNIMLQMVGEWIIHNPDVSTNFDDIRDTILKTHYFQLMLRSSLGKKGLILPNGVGIIDLDYEDEIKMIIHNPAKVDTYETSLKTIRRELIMEEDIIIKKGDKIAQITLLEHKSYLFNIDTDEERQGGFGSTDKDTK